MTEHCMERAIGVPFFARGTQTPFIARETDRYQLGSRRVAITLKLRYLQDLGEGPPDQTTGNPSQVWVDCTHATYTTVDVQLVRILGHRTTPVGKAVSTSLGQVTNYNDGNLNRTTARRVLLRLDRALAVQDVARKKGSRARHGRIGVRTAIVSAPESDSAFPGSTPQDPRPKQYYFNGICNGQVGDGALCVHYPENLTPHVIKHVQWIPLRTRKRLHRITATKPYMVHPPGG